MGGGGGGGGGGAKPPPPPQSNALERTHIFNLPEPVLDLLTPRTRELATTARNLGRARHISSTTVHEAHAMHNLSMVFKRPANLEAAARLCTSPRLDLGAVPHHFHFVKPKAAMRSARTILLLNLARRFNVVKI